MERRRPYIGAAFALGSALLFSTKGVAVKVALPYGVDATTLLGLRMGMALPVFAVMAWHLGRQAGTPLSARDRWQAAGLGLLGYHLASWLDFQGLRFIDAGLERQVLYIYPTLVVILGSVLRRRMPSWIEVGALVVTYAGVALCCGGYGASGAHQLLGVALVAVSAAVYAVFIVASGPPIKRLGSQRFMAVAMTAACVGVLVHALLAAPWSAWVQPGAVYAYGGYLAIAGTVIPALLTAAALQLIGSSRFAILTTIGPVGTVLCAWLMLGERPTLVAVLGMILTLAGVSAISLAKAKD